MSSLDFLSDNNDKPLASQAEVLDNWKVLIVDDEEDVHSVTKIALDGFEYNQRGLIFLDAYSAEQAKEILASQSDIAFVLLDVVMETKSAGLDLVDWIRNKLKNDAIRIVLRTGQPGEAPEKEIILNYDLSDYKEKSELTALKLFSVACTSIRSYQNIIRLMSHQSGLEKVVKASGDLYTYNSLSLFIEGVLEQVFALIQSSEHYFNSVKDGVAITIEDEKATIIAGTGKYRNNVSQTEIPKDLELTLDQILSFNHQSLTIINDKLIIILDVPHSTKTILFLHILNINESLIKNDNKLLQLFMHNVQFAFENIVLQNETEVTQREIAYRLGEAIETRSKESGEHVKRVAFISKELALLAGLSEREASVIKIASPLHDIGKISIPDNILHKHGKLNSEEWHIMQQHAQIGENMLKGSKLEIIRIAGLIAGGHHERWDGQGYPKGLVGDKTPISARITAIADVFDALRSERCYKKAWPLDESLEQIKKGSGTQFEPELVNLFLNNYESIIKSLKY